MTNIKDVSGRQVDDGHDDDKENDYHDEIAMESSFSARGLSEPVFLAIYPSRASLMAAMKYMIKNAASSGSVGIKVNERIIRRAYMVFHNINS